MSDQLDLMDDRSLDDIDIKKLLEFFKAGESMEEQMITLYASKDLEGLSRISSSMSPAAETVLLTNRNRVMLRSMDSILRSHRLFAAVGALHLPGKNGLITLLREKGYTVQPVVCKTTTNGAKYLFKKDGPGWMSVTSEADNYSIRMPGVPGDVDLYEGLVKMKSYFDLTTGRYYMAGHIPLPPGADVQIKNVIREMEKSIFSGNSETEKREAENGGLRGMEYFFTDKEHNHYHVQMIGSDQAGVYLLMVFSKSWDIRNVDSFFKSFKLLGKPGQQPAQQPTKGYVALGTPKVLWKNNFDFDVFTPQQTGFSSDSKYFAMGRKNGDVTIYDANLHYS